jgi:hypothetical protein
VAHLLHRQDDEGEGRQEGAGAADSHQPVGQLGPASALSIPRRMPCSIARRVSSMRTAGYAAVPTVLANSDESQHAVNRDRRCHAALASIASHMCVFSGR